MTTVNTTQNVVTVNATQTGANINVISGIVQINTLTRTRYTGSLFSGTTGDTYRSIVHSSSISTNAVISISGRFLDTSEFTLSTGSLTNDTLTIHINLFDDDVVQIWD